MAKPFVKWAGGKGKLLNILGKRLPSDFDEQANVTYIEPFVGGGAMLFYMLSTHKTIRRVIINDINPELMSCYDIIKNDHEKLIAELRERENEYYSHESQEKRNDYYLLMRDEYNKLHLNSETNDFFAKISKASLFIFLNRTCFNGLYRENSKGEFNVPVGRYVHPIICNEKLIKEVHLALQNVELLNGDYKDILTRVNPEEYNFFYIDPPYRPLLGSNNFKEYTKFVFGDKQQEELKAFCDIISQMGAKLMLSNSDSEIEPGRNYFEELYKAEDGYYFDKINAPRVINAFAANRVPQREVLITNYKYDHNLFFKI